MKNYVSFLVIYFLLFQVGNLFSPPSNAQPAQGPKDVWQKPWEGVPEHYRNWDYPDFQFPADISEWKKQRIEVQETLLKLLGDRPPRPKSLQIKTIFRKKQNGYILEKFEFDNGVDGWVPGYIAIPANLQGKAPAILGLHGHGSSKDNILGTNPDTQQAIMALLVSNGFIVMAIDSYFNGERRGTGPAGTHEMQERGRTRRCHSLRLTYGLVVLFGECSFVTSR